MLNWFRREKSPRELPESWQDILSRNARFRDELDLPQRDRLDQRVITFVDAKWDELLVSLGDRFVQSAKTSRKIKKIVSR